MRITDWIIAGAALVTAGILLWQWRQVRTLTAQRDEAQQYRDGLLRAVDDVVLALDADRRILSANPAAEALVGRDPTGDTLTGAIDHPDLETLLQDAQRLGSESVERRIELNKHVFNARAVAATNGTGPLAILTLRDVTQIQRLERARREMVSNVTHELSTPITSIGLLADTLLNLAIKEKPKRTRKMAEDIRREVDTLTHLVQEMRDLSLIESGQMPVRLMPTDLRLILQNSIDPLVVLAENKRQIVTLDVPENIRVLVDELQIERAIKNIVHNAIKFSPEGGTIQIAATSAEGEATIAIRDSGPGIPADELPRIFERFYQVDRARREGTGLGLAIVRHIVMAHAGRAWAESVEGQGATFYVTLALAEPVPQADAEQA
jgi:two-component system phosphate regulon sensor histidine kinase PhoR